MKRYERSFLQAASRISHAATLTAQDYATRLLPDEPSFTAALVTRFRDTLISINNSGISWSATVLTSHGPGSEEKKFGADFLGLLTLDLEELVVKKGFLAQAKCQEPGTPLVAAEWARLVGQCNQMLSFTPESFVFVYSLNGVLMIPAIAVASCKNRVDLHTLNPERTAAFYKRHFQCSVGDRRIDDSKVSKLENLSYRTGIAITGARKASRKNIHHVKDE